MTTAVQHARASETILREAGCFGEASASDGAVYIALRGGAERDPVASDIGPVREVGAPIREVGAPIREVGAPIREVGAPIRLRDQLRSAVQASP